MTHETIQPLRARPNVCAAAAFSLVAMTLTGAVAAPPAWTQARFQVDTGPAHQVRLTIDVYPDGRVVFGGDEADVSAPTVAQAPPELLATVTAWAATGPTDGPTPTDSDGRLRVRLSGERERRAIYPVDAIPIAERTLYYAVSALINAQRTPAPCPAWDGKGDFSLTFLAQDFGVAPGPVTRLTYSSKGDSTRAVALGAPGDPSRVEKATRASAAEVSAIRAALIAVDLGHFTEVHGGSGEGSNLRLVHLRTQAGTCGRGFTNAYPEALRPLVEAAAPVAARLAK